MAIAHIGERADDADRTPEEKAVGDPGEALLPGTAALALRASRARAAVQENERSPGQVRLDDLRSEGCAIRE